MTAGEHSDSDLVSDALKAMENAYAPYSGYRVGAAALTPGGRVFTGCNVENRSYGLTVCAERNAISAAVAAGETGIAKVAVVSDGKRRPLPCGACLQVMDEFGVKEVLVGNPDGTFENYNLRELLPRPFGRDG